MTDVILRTEGMSKSFGAVMASEDVSLDLRAGEIHAIIGPNGAGKSTLIGQICGAIEPDRGRVVLNGADVTELPVHARAQLGLARTFQISTLAMEDSVLEHVLLGVLSTDQPRLGLWRGAKSYRSAEDRARTVLERVGLSAVASRRVAKLSHAQRRQLDVAIALTLRPKALVMDEPMAGLGTDGSRMMTELLGRLRQEAPILLVEHDMDAVFALADRISVLVYGKIIASGSVDQIRSNADVREAYLGDLL
ncbi:ABC transporter ATP-binding protein [Litoreibacter roseus]|uniref:ABC transporter ATP-binding protein n=1 Tax=Litoreibacter roseus TaxID=2601869 RepID=A0A6N6JJZ7_9RHOB|nr:ABC transporter ATP-binding protein [Litoreibacter roseus]GFE65598.1 ABC transporter ATP-binding protein [Litoreibacter roseus]